ncbi:MAG: hypothetical protein AB7S26_36610 [Sandaracinaceae bacterium]
MRRRFENAPEQATTRGTLFGKWSVAGSAAAFLALGLTGCPPGELDSDAGEYMPDTCDEYSYRGETYDCTALDRCDETDFQYRLACCECDPALCDPDPACGGPRPTTAAESCMSCHNGSEYNDYAGPGQSNPHPFGAENNIPCTTCHGGDGTPGVGRELAHVPPPPEIGDERNLVQDPEAYFNYLTLAGPDNYPDYTVDGRTYTALEWLQFINPGDFRIVTQGEGCGTPGCHADEHAAWAPLSVIENGTGMLSGAAYTAGLPNHITEYANLWEDTAAEYGARARTDPEWMGPTDNVGSIGRVDEFPTTSVYGDRAGIYDNPLYDATQFANYLEDDPRRGVNRILPNTPLEDTFLDAVAITCGDCHGGSRGANNRYGDFRSSGCTACHMEYSPDGRSRSRDPNVNHYEPANPDAIAAPERSHIDSHQIRNVAKTLPDGAFVRGISDYACAGCHQGSNRTVMQFWGIRLDQNADLAQGNAYPAAPDSFQNTAADDRLFDPAIQNTTFNGRNANQYILTEDYDGDGRDDTPADVHYEAGLGCIDCHGSRDLHGGTRGDDSGGRIQSRMSQVTQVGCTNCHGTVESYTATVPCRTYTGEEAECATDRAGNPLRHVTRDTAGQVWLISRLNGTRHYIPQTRDTVVDNGIRNPQTAEFVFQRQASYAMGRADGNNNTGIGPIQQNPDIYEAGFSHMDTLACETCHSSWQNNCVGCHLRNAYNADPASYFFSTITGERITTFQQNADFTYITPVPNYLGVNSRGEISPLSPGIQMFYAYTDLNGNTSDTFVFSDRQGNGNNPNYTGRDAHPAASADFIMPHSIRGRVSAQMEGPRYCVNCHLNDAQIANFGAAYDQFRTAMATRNYNQLNFNQLQQHIGQNPGNQLNSPLWVHMVAGLGSGLFLFDENGCPVNPLDNNNNRFFCNGTAPAAQFNLNNVAYNLDGFVEPDGTSNTSSSHPAQSPRVGTLRSGANNAGMSGPLGRELIQRLTDPQFGIILDSWIDADGQPQGNAANYINN